MIYRSHTRRKQKNHRNQEFSVLTAKNRTQDISLVYGAVRKKMDPRRTLDDRHQSIISTEIRSQWEYIDKKKSYNLMNHDSKSYSNY